MNNISHDLYIHLVDENSEQRDRLCKELERNTDARNYLDSARLDSIQREFSAYINRRVIIHAPKENSNEDRQYIGLLTGFQQTGTVSPAFKPILYRLNPDGKVGRMLNSFSLPTYEQIVSIELYN